ncbi:hypothetical protein LUD75_02545 [Epilithonimonas sp. JDS]|uniref:hypothetical protein n=1 Tax=Epilithonimonas sp. JDS TaxID=2902797 RepID=UPI001E5E417B|nr:hypothetical protein [Epilithonimonas sp. JDS]MCD9853570.1 hypothetical protein [Epilithonimonas sp. JDS]
MQNLIYNPWIGKNYGNSELGKLLIIGDSHYFNNGLPNNLNDFTKAQIAELDIIAGKFHKTILEVFGYQKHADFWKNIAFANSIQSAFTSSNQVPTNAEKDIAEKAFREYLEITEPEKVIVFSSRIWEHCFNKAVWGKHLDKIDERWNIRELDYDGGTCKAIGLHHPSTPGFNKSKFQKVIFEFLKDY